MKKALLYTLYCIRLLLAPFLREVVVLAYHSVSNDTADTAITPEVFRRQLELLKRAGYTFVTLEDVVRWQRGEGSIPKRAVAVTFDDGYEDFETAALPLLALFAAPVTLFIVQDRETYRRTLSTALTMLDADAVGRIAHHPLVEVGYHTKTHLDVRTLTYEGLLQECKPPSSMRFFAYPGGGYSDDACRALKEIGYEAAFSIKPELVSPKHNRFILPRVVVTRGMNDLEFRARATAAGSWYRALKRTLFHG